MNNNFVLEYLNYVENNLYTFFRLLLGEEYNKKLLKPFIDKYINVRYFNNTIYQKEPEIVNKISKEINNIAKEAIKDNPDYSEAIKNICALFGYILYFDNCIKYNDYNSLINTLFLDDIVKISKDEMTKEKFKAFILETNAKKDGFLKLFKTNDFIVNSTKIYRNIYKEEIDYNFNVSKLYSKNAIETAFKSGIINENRLYALYLMVAQKVLQNAINLNFDDYFIVDFPDSLINKTKKILKYFRVFDLDLLKEHVSILITHKLYLDNTKIINEYINQGYNFCVVIDSSFKGDINSLILFNYVIISVDNKYYDEIMDNKDKLQIKVIRK